jgi:fructokinase
MSHSQVYLGIDLGGTKIEIIALNTIGECLYRTRIATPASNTSNQYQQIQLAIKSLVDDCEQHLQLSNLPVGIGIPGAISQSTGLVKNANTICLIGNNLSTDLKNTLNRPVKIENDANCFALSEALDGAAESANCVLAVILGTGVGGGWVINKKLHLGSNAIAGEWGHNPLPWPSEKDEPKQTCYCGKSGCIETYLSGPGFSQQTQLQFDLSASCPEIIKSIHSNSLAKQSYDLYVDRMARSLANVINIMDPDAIVLGGGVSNIDSLYIDVPNIWGKYIFSDTVNTRLIKNKYGDSSGVRGAAWLNK